MPEETAAFLACEAIRGATRREVPVQEKAAGAETVGPTGARQVGRHRSHADHGPSQRPADSGALFFGRARVSASVGWAPPDVHQHDDHAWDLLERAVQLTNEEALTVWTGHHPDDKQEDAVVRPRSQEGRQEDE